MRAAAELGLRTVAIHSREDRFSLHRTKADESYLVGDGKGPIEAYLDIADIIRIATEARVDAIHPGYGFLSESPEFAEACAAANIIFVGPLPDTMRRLGNKVEARNLAAAAGVPVMPATPPLPADEIPLLFEPFQRGSNARPETVSLGLGLFIAKQIVLAHAGKIQVTSSAEQGTTFTVLWPRRSLVAEQDTKDALPH